MFTATPVPQQSQIPIAASDNITSLSNLKRQLSLLPSRYRCCRRPVNAVRYRVSCALIPLSSPTRHCAGVSCCDRRPPGLKLAWAAASRDGGADASRPVIRLWTTKAEREGVDSRADLFAIIQTAERLEKAYVRDIVSPAVYETECFALLAKFKTLRAALGDLDVERFMAEHRMDCPKAANRLLRSGMPATVEHAGNSGGAGGGGGGGGDGSSFHGSAAHVADSVSGFITVMDTVKLNMLAVDQVYPVLADLAVALGHLRLPGEYTGAAKVRRWLSTVHAMRASDVLSAEQARQLLFELETGYADFMAIIKAPGR